MEEFNIEDPGSALQQAVCEFMGVKDIPVDEAFDYLVDQLAEIIGRKAKGHAELAYSVTKIAILATAQAVGIGVLSLDTTGFSLARITAAVEDIQKKVDSLVGNPKKLAIDSYWNVLNKLQYRQIPAMIKEVGKMIDHAKAAYFLATSSEKPTMEHLKDAVHMKILEMIAELLQSSFDEQNGVIKPFCLLSSELKTCTANIMKKAIRDLKLFKEKVNTTKRWGLINDDEQISERQDVMDSAYRVAYPFISEAFGKTNPTVELISPFEFPVMVQMLPEGANDKTRVTIGQESGKQRAVWLWRDVSEDGGRVLVATWEGAVTGFAYKLDDKELDVKINFPSEGRITSLRHHLWQCCRYNIGW